MEMKLYYSDIFCIFKAMEKWKEASFQSNLYQLTQGLSFTKNVKTHKLM